MAKLWPDREYELASRFPYRSADHTDDITAGAKAAIPRRVRGFMGIAALLAMSRAGDASGQRRFAGRNQNC
jgi:hypothetical protein